MQRTFLKAREARSEGLRAEHDATGENLGFGDGDVPPILRRGATRWQGQPAGFKRGNLRSAFIGQDADHDFSFFGELIDKSARTWR